MPKQDKIAKLIEDSGHDLHFKVAKILRGSGWSAEIGEHYTDPITAKLREVDIVAIKKFPVFGSSLTQNKVDLTVRLFVGCKYLPVPYVVWFEDKNMEEAKNLAMDNAILRDKDEINIGLKTINPRRVHHYIENGLVGKLWTKSGQRDVLFDSINESVNASLAFKGEADAYTVDYPIAVVHPSDRLHRRDEGPTSHSPLTETFQIELGYRIPDAEGRSQRKHFIVDVVQADLLESFLKKIEEADIAILKEVLSWDLHEQARIRPINEDYSSLF